MFDMRMATAERWAVALKISTEEFNEYLKKLHYQKESIEDNRDLTSIWTLTSTGKKYGRKSYNPFKHDLLWNIDAFFDVMKIRGKITRKYSYCDKCDSFLGRQSGFDINMEHWVCKKCGHINKLFYDPNDYC